VNYSFKVKNHKCLHYLNFRFANNDSEIRPLVCNNLQIVRFPSVYVEYTAINLENSEVKLKALWESDFSAI